MQVIRFVVIVAVATFAGAGPSGAQDEAPPAGTTDKAVSGRASFGRGPVDFWGDKAKAAAKPRADGDTSESLWAEPIRTPDGRVTIYVPPKAVLQFLDRPTPETAKAYLAWQSERMKKLKAAIEMLRELQKKEEEETPKKDEGASQEALPPSIADKDKEPRSQGDAGAPASEASAPFPAGQVLHFKKAGCPWCEKQDLVFKQLSADAPQLKVEAVGPEDPRWKEYGVAVTPTLVVTLTGGRRFLVRGYTSAADLARILQEGVNREK